MGKYDVGEEIGGGLKDIGQAMYRREALDRQQRALEQTGRHQAVTEEHQRALEDFRMQEIAEKQKMDKIAFEKDQREQSRRNQNIDVLSESEMQRIKDEEPEIFQQKILPMFEQAGLKYAKHPVTEELIMPMKRGEFEDKIKEWGRNPTNMEYAHKIKLDLANSASEKSAKELFAFDEKLVGKTPTPQQIEERERLKLKAESASQTVNAVKGQDIKLGQNIAIARQQATDILNASPLTEKERARIAPIANSGDLAKTQTAIDHIIKNKELASRQEDRQAFQREKEETTMFPVKDAPELSRNRQGKLFVQGETDVPVNPTQYINLRLANQQMKQELKAGFTASANNQLQAIKSLVLPANGKPSSLDELKQMRAEAFAKPGDISAIRNELSKYAGKETDDSQFRVLNKIEMALKKQLTSDPKLAAFWSKLQATAEQLGRYYSGGGNVTSDFKIRFAMELLDAGYQQKAFEAVVDTHANAMKHTQTILERARNNPAEQYRVTVQSILNGARLKAGKQIESDTTEIPETTTPVPQGQALTQTTKKTKSGKTYTIKR